MASSEPVQEPSAVCPQQEPEIDLELEFFVDSIDDAMQGSLNDRILKAAKWVATRFQLQQLQVSVSVVDDATIQAINRKHLQHDWPTDVISFAFESGKVTNGEVIASWDTARRLCQPAGWPPQEELILYILHGLLHLAGLDDQDQEQRMTMRLAEQAYLKSEEVPGADEYLQRFEDVSY